MPPFLLVGCPHLGTSVGIVALCLEVLPQEAVVIGLRSGIHLAMSLSNELLEFGLHLRRLRPTAIFQPPLSGREPLPAGHCRGKIYRLPAGLARWFPELGKLREER